MANGQRRNNMKRNVFFLIRGSLETRITPLAYLFCLWQFNFSLNHALPGKWGAGTTTLAQTEALLPSEVWGILLAVNVILLAVSMLFKRATLVQMTGMAGVVLWTMALMGYAMSGYWVMHATGSFIMMLIYGYFYLSASQGTLWDYTPSVSDE